MKEILEKLVAKKTEYNLTEQRFDNSTDAAEVRSLGEALNKLKADIAELEKELEAAQEKEEPKEEKPTSEEKPADEKPAADDEEIKNESRSSMDALKSYGVNNMENTNDLRATMEYRSAYKDYVQKGVIADNLMFRNNKTGAVIEARAAGPMTSADLGVLLPTTIVQAVIKDVEKSYGQLYSRVKKLNVQGGIKLPIGSFSATFNRIVEGGNTSDRQKAGAISGYVEFTYKLGEIRISQTLLESIVTVEAFEAEVAKTIVEAYVQAMEAEILNGDGAANQMEGILKNESKIPAGNIITLSAADMKDWTVIQKKLFAKVPLAMRKESPEFAVTVNTYEGNFKALADDNNRPLAREVYNVADNAEKAVFNNKEVYFVEEGLGIANFDEAAEGDVVGLYWVPEKAYAINSNLEFATKRYFDEDKLEWVERAIVINDGKILDPKYIFLLKKGLSA